MHYFIDYHKSDPDVAALTVDDLRVGRLQVLDPAPIPEDELRRTVEWMKSWDMIDQQTDPSSLIDSEIQERAHQLAAG